MQCDAVCYGALSCAVVGAAAWMSQVVHVSVMQCAAVHCSALQHVRLR